MSDTILTAKELSKSFGRTEVLRDINITISRGEAIGLIGQNGAGKTTMLRIISGLMKPTGGYLELQSGKKYLGYMPQSCRFHDHSTVADTIRFFARIRKVDGKQSTILGERLRLDLTRKVKYLSPGQQKKLLLVLAMIGEPELYILDEPTAGLDPNATFEMKNMIKELHQKGKSILISSHILQDMDDLCTNIAIMEKGSITYHKELESSYIIKTTPLNQETYRIIAERYPVVSDINYSVHTVKIEEEQVPTLIAVLVAQQVGIYEVTATKIRNLVQRQMKQEEATNPGRKVNS